MFPKHNVDLFLSGNFIVKNDKKKNINNQLRYLISFEAFIVSLEIKQLSQNTTHTLYCMYGRRTYVDPWQASTAIGHELQ